MNTQCIVGSPEGTYLFKNVSYLSHFTTQTVVFYVYQKTMLNLHNTKSRHHKWLLLIILPISKVRTSVSEKELEQEIKNKGDQFRWKNNMKIL